MNLLLCLLRQELLPQNPKVMSTVPLKVMILMSAHLVPKDLLVDQHGIL